MWGFPPRVWTPTQLLYLGTYRAQRRPNGLALQYQDKVLQWLTFGEKTPRLLLVAGSVPTCLASPILTTAFTATRTMALTPSSTATAMRFSTGPAATSGGKCPSPRAASGKNGHLPLALAGMLKPISLIPLSPLLLPLFSHA